MISLVSRSYSINAGSTIVSAHLPEVWTRSVSYNGAPFGSHNCFSTTISSYILFPSVMDASKPVNKRVSDPRLSLQLQLFRKYGSLPVD